MIVGKIESLWRYPVKSMRGEEVQDLFVGFAGVYGDRVYAFQSSVARKGFPYLTGREQEQMLLYRPRFRHPEGAAKPVNLADAEAIGSGLTPVYADISELMVDVETPSGEVLPIDDPKLMEMLLDGTRDNHELTLLRSHHAMTDCRPVSLISVQTVRQLSQESGIDLDKRRFRANLYADLEKPFGEDEFVGRTLRIGSRAEVAILKRDARCKMITLDPDSAEMNPDVLRTVASGHENQVGVYGAVLVEGTVRPGDPIVVV